MASRSPATHHSKATRTAASTTQLIATEAKTRALSVMNARLIRRASALARLPARFRITSPE
jgi:hypothetical protein